MPRNFYRRVEVMFPVEAEDLRRRIVEEIIPAYLQDNRRARILCSDGTYMRPGVTDGEPSFRSQTDLLAVCLPRPASAPPPLSAPATQTLTPAETNGDVDYEKKRKKEKKTTVA